ncbi:hypothetical protein SDC9_37312 [bioreactor metagenome]|uniref:Uncharacterized protein n=1 Tax=bioreactor metagenome TaxID=1076179 RepID=A0A644VIW1_9ZZZZ|nr:GRAM domain-containing protein [Negativicutes bacterium]
MYSFPLVEQERIIKKDHANLYCDGNAFAGAFYLTSNRIVFVGYLLDIHDKYVEEVPLSHIAEVTPGKTFFVIPNVLNVSTIRNRTLKLIVKGRDHWLAAIKANLERI